MSERPRETDELLLPSGESVSALAYLGFEPIRQGMNKIEKIDFGRSFLDVFAGDPFGAQPHIGSNRSGK